MSIHDLPELSLIPGCEAAEEFCSVQESPAVYLVFLEGGARILASARYRATDNRPRLQFDGMVHVYTGAAENVRSRLIQHFRRDSRGSSLRKTLLAIEHATKAISSSGTPRCAVSDEPSLSEWLFRNCLVAIAHSSEPFVLEREIVKSYDSPLNITHQRRNPYAKQLMCWRKTAFSPRRMRTL